MQSYPGNAPKKLKRKQSRLIGAGDITIYNPNGTIKEILSIEAFKKNQFKQPKAQEQKFNDRETPEYYYWRQHILHRDKNRCVLCGSKEFLNVHHIIRWIDNKELRYDDKNGVTLCVLCHTKNHGPKNNPFPESINKKLRNYIGEAYGNN